MNLKLFKTLALSLLSLLGSCTMGAGWVSEHDLVLHEPSNDSSRSMPLVGASLGCDVWFDENSIMLYPASPEAVGEGGAQLKYGRVRINTIPNIFATGTFEQRLSLEDGAIYVSSESEMYGKNQFRIWIESGQPVAHIDVESELGVKLVVTYENWRDEAMPLASLRFPDVVDQQASAQGQITADYIKAGKYGVEFCHSTPMAKDEYNHFGGKIVGEGMLFTKRTSGSYDGSEYVGFAYRMRRTKRHNITIVTHTAHAARMLDWHHEMGEKINEIVGDDVELRWIDNRLWWREFWSQGLKHRSNDGRYNLYRYMLVSGFTSPALS